MLQEAKSCVQSTQRKPDDCYPEIKYVCWFLCFQHNVLKLFLGEFVKQSQRSPIQLQHKL